MSNITASSNAYNNISKDLLTEDGNFKVFSIKKYIYNAYIDTYR